MGLISSNTLFHFTNSAEIIIKIIKNGFYPRFCLEEFGVEIFLEKDLKVEQAMPLTCFCDIPLSQIEEHLEFYGSYGIGLTKEWAKQNGITPLTYIHENSSQLDYLRQLGRLVKDISKSLDHEKIPFNNNPAIALMELVSFFKPYIGQMWRHNKYVDKRFYDEREWRYVPFLNSKEIEYRLDKEEFLNDIKRAAANEMIAKDFALKFKFSDIKYLIVKREEEMVALSDALEGMTNIYSSNEIKILKTKIISSEQIKEDF